MQQVRIDFDNPGLPQSLGVVEGESQSRIFQAALYKSGAAYTAPAGAVYSIMYRGFGPQNQGWYDTIEDGAGKRAACTVSGNVVTCELARQALRVPGHLTVVLCVSDAKGYMLKSWPIMADVRNDGYEDTGEIEMYFNLSGLAGNYLTQLEKAMANAETTKNTLTSTSAQVQKDIDAKAAAALESIPEEYTELDGNVKQLKEDLTGVEGVIDVHKNYVDASLFEVGYYSLSDSGAINKNDVNTSYKKYKLDSVPSGSYMVLNLRGIFCIVEDLITGTKRNLATTDININGLITIENKSNVYLTISGNVEKTYFVSGNTPVPVYVDKVGLYSYILEDSVKPTIYVEKDGTGNFTTLKEALEYSLVHPFTTIYVGNGTYDLIEEFGNDYFTNFTGGSRAGLKLDNYVHIIFSSNAKVICNYTGDNDKIKKDFSPFNTIAGGQQQKGFILENLNLECSNVRYAMHDETSGQANPYRNVYKNCRMVIDNSDNTQGYPQCIGGGLGSSAEIIIENCYFESIHTDQTYDIVSYHNGGNGKSNIVVTGCYFAGKDRCRCSNSGSATEVSIMMVSNCSLGAEPRIIDEVSGANQNMRLIKWNNEIRTN